MKKSHKLDVKRAKHDEAYDLSISDEVNLSKVLDEMLRTYEKPDVIVSFLKMHDNDFSNIIAHSLAYARMFMLDFIIRLSPENVKYIIAKLDEVVELDDYVTMLCCWQALSPYALTDSHTKAMFMTAAARLNKKASCLRHPYVHFCTQLIKDFDLRMFEIIAHEGRAPEIAAYVNSLPASVWGSVMYNVRSSLFCV